MDAFHREIISINHSDLIEKTENIGLVIDELVHKGIISEEIAQQITKKGNPTEQSNDLYRLIPKCGHRAFKALLEAFYNTGNEAAACILKENRLSNTSPTEGMSPVEELDEFHFHDEKYRMKSTPRGAVLLVNVLDYNNSWKERRDGSEKDVEGLTHLFQDMGFVVRKETSGRKADIEESLRKWKDSPFLSVVDCGIIILMAHGQERLSGSVEIATADCQFIDTEWIISLLTSSEAPRLHGKPKLIFILSCRGMYPDLGTDLEKLRDLQEAANSNGNMRLDAFSFDTHTRSEGFAPISPHLSDVLLIYPCAPGKASSRDIFLGSWFVQEMISVFQKKAHRDDVESMLKEMDRNLIKQRQSGEKCSFQTICYTSRGFRRKLFLNPISSFRNSPSNSNDI